MTATDSAPISVMSRVLSGIGFSAYPDKILYVAQDIFESDGIVVKAEYEKRNCSHACPRSFDFFSEYLVGFRRKRCGYGFVYGKNNVVASAQIFVKGCAKDAYRLKDNKPAQQSVYLAGDEFLRRRLESRGSVRKSCLA